jgi:hypothetical protein
MTGSPLPTAKYVLICDDIREEKSNKIILIGLYANKIIIDSLPGLIPKLCIRICFDMSGPCADRFHLVIRRPDGGEIGPFFVMIPPPSDEFLESSININIVPFPLEQEGIYEIVVQEGGREAPIGRFGVASMQASRGMPS